MDIEFYEKLNLWISLGFQIDYDIVNQVENGCYRSSVDNYFTYSFYITPYDLVSREKDDIIYNISVDRLDEGFASCLKWLEMNQDDLFKDYLSSVLTNYDYLLKYGVIELTDYESEHLLSNYLKLKNICYFVEYNFDSCEIRLDFLVN